MPLFSELLGSHTKHARRHHPIRSSYLFYIVRMTVWALHLRYMGTKTIFPIFILCNEFVTVIYTCIKAIIPKISFTTFRAP